MHIQNIDDMSLTLGVLTKLLKSKPLKSDKLDINNICRDAPLRRKIDWNMDSKY